MLGAMTSLTGGGGLSAGGGGPSTASSNTSTTNNSGFTGGSVNMGSNNGFPAWAIVLIALVALYVFTRK
ncbi:hypothetical protein [Aliivibrio kagoshimensis]|uniref:hypothetical protein n=1 Tax=Aliivibrio kagoshimensis TaxID=2910230 RepID=UPI003D137FC9